MTNQERAILPQYWMSLHAYVHVSAQSSIWLDLRSNRYYGLDAWQTQCLSRVVQDWPCMPLPCDSTREATLAAALELAKDLVDRGLLTQDVELSHSAAPPRIPPAERSLHAWQETDLHSTQGIDAWHFLDAYASARTRLRMCSLERVVARIRRKQDSSVPDLELLRERTRAFLALRPFFYAVREQCLLDSLTLIEFLRPYGLFPTLVIGVRPIPFAAHCWVQAGQYVLNGEPTSVRAFSPIFAI